VSVTLTLVSFKNQFGSHTPTYFWNKQIHKTTNQNQKTVIIITTTCHQSWKNGRFHNSICLFS